MISILVLGHRGMLGNAVFKYFSSNPKMYKVLTLNERWGEKGFERVLASISANFVVNCIGAIPQKYGKQPEKYNELNVKLPLFLETTGLKIIHPSTDCEFSGKLLPEKKYFKTDIRDAEDEYGRSKAYISERIEKGFANTKIIRVSIIGHETGNSNKSLLEWVLSSTGVIKGYTDHYWNGITTLQWAKLCESLIADWAAKPLLNQYGTEKVVSKYELISIITKVYNHPVHVEPSVTGHCINKSLESDSVLPPISDQLRELRYFYGK